VAEMISNGPEDRVARLAESEFFQDLTPDELRSVSPLVSEAVYSRGEFLYNPEEIGDRLYVLEEGKVKLARASEQGKEVTLAILTPGCVFGELSLGERRRFGAYAEVLDRAQVFTIGRQEFEQIVARCPRLALRTIEAVLDRLNWAEEQIEDLVFRSVPARVASLLLRLSEVHGRVGPRGVTVDLRLTHQEIGNMVGATRETITNVLSDLRGEGLIDVRKKRVLLLDQAKLRELAQG